VENAVALPAPICAVHVVPGIILMF